VFCRSVGTTISMTHNLHSTVVILRALLYRGNRNRVASGVRIGVSNSHLRSLPSRRREGLTFTVPPTPSPLVYCWIPLDDIDICAGEVQRSTQNWFRVGECWRGAAGLGVSHADLGGAFRRRSLHSHPARTRLPLCEYSYGPG